MILLVFSRHLSDLFKQLNTKDYRYLPTTYPLTLIGGYIWYSQGRRGDLMINFDGTIEGIARGVELAKKQLGNAVDHGGKALTTINNSLSKEAINGTISKLRLENCGKLVTKNGEFRDVSFPLPSDAAFPHEGTDLAAHPIIFVNGINCNEDVAAGIGEQFANACSSPVFLLYNQSIHLVHDVAESVTDKIGLTRKPAAEALSRLLLEAFEQSAPLHFAAHSHGAVVVSQGISYAIDEIKKRGPDEPSKFSDWLESITVETFGGAATQYPDGPRYIHYVDPRDLVPWFAGVAKHGLSEEQIRQHEEVVVSQGWANQLSKLAKPITKDLTKPGKDSVIIRIAELYQSGDQSEVHSLIHYINMRRNPEDVLKELHPQGGTETITITTEAEEISITESLRIIGNEIRQKARAGIVKLKDRFRAK
jgi:hypothetical protein